MHAALAALLLLAAPARAPAPDRAGAPVARHAPLHLPRVEGPPGAPLLVIDPGHGGRDPGSSGPDGTREKDVALRIAQAIRAAVRAEGRLRVALTRDDDRFLALAERREIARTLDAGLLVSIHCDSAANPAARGASLYTLAAASTDRAAATLAQRENRADLAGGDGASGGPDDVASILVDLARRETLAQAVTFAGLLGRELAPAIGLRPGFHRAATLVVLKAPDVPSVLLEAGYLSNAADRGLLMSSGYRRVLATGVARAADAYFARRPIGAGAAGETMR